MLAKILSYIPALVGLFITSLFIFLNNPSNKKNKIFALLNLLASFWLLFLFLADISTEPNIALWLLRIALFFGQLMFLAFFFFAVTFPFTKSGSSNNLKQILIAVPMVLLSLSLLTPLGVKSVSVQSFGVQPEQTGVIYALSDFLGIIYLICGTLILVSKMKKASLKEKSQIKIVLLGLGFAAIVNIFTGIVLTSLHIETNAILLGGASLFIFSLFVSYAMIKHHFFDIRAVVARTLAYVLSIGTMVLIYALFISNVSKLLFPNETIILYRQVLYLSSAILLGLMGPTLKKFFDKLSNRFFYQDAYETQNLLNDLNSSLATVIDIDSILKDTSLLLEHYIKPTFVAFFVFDKSNNSPKSFFTGELQNVSKDKVFEIAKLFPDRVTEVIEDPELTKDILGQAINSSMGLVSKLSSPSDKNNTVGILVLGNKKSGSVYTKQDHRAIEIITDELVIALQNAMRFEEIQQFNITLQKKVDDATRELKKANEKLIALDQTKDDFISMASHQLRTPLTSVKGYVSMVMEGDVGKITKQQHKLLDQAFLSSQRMVYLIADLLNVSRLKTGKFVIEAKPTNLADLVEGELSQLTETIKAKKLRLTYKKPKNFPLIMLDDTKTRQVVMNFVDNAIYYTPENGKIDVIVEEKDKTIEFRVVDNGIGVPKSEQHNLFGKFFRAGNARKARPDGTGLGLFMAKKVIIAQGGTLIFKSEENKGSTFGFSFEKTKLKPPQHVTNK